MKSNSTIALVTGGSRGLGKNTALRLAEKGIDVIITYRTKKEEAEAVVKSMEEMGVKAGMLPLDMAEINSFNLFINQLRQCLAEKWDRSSIDFLVNNAGVSVRSSIQETAEDDFDYLMNIHFKGVYFLTQKMIPLIAEGGRIINLSTGLTRFTTLGYAAYASMKGAIEVFTKYLAKELGPKKITTNIVAPGIIKTDFTRDAFNSGPQFEEMIASQIALGRAGVPEDIGGVIAFLCTPEAGWINAQRIEVSGGMLL